jgi:pimeloyl-ACP methyl ester carboxylesterase
MADQPNIVLVHGAWADGSSWTAAIDRLQAAGYRVTAPQFPMTRLAEPSILCGREDADRGRFPCASRRRFHGLRIL